MVKTAPIVCCNMFFSLLLDVCNSAFKKGNRNAPQPTVQTMESSIVLSNCHMCKWWGQPDHLPSVAQSQHLSSCSKTLRTGLTAHNACKPNIFSNCLRFKMKGVKQHLHFTQLICSSFVHLLIYLFSSITVMFLSTVSLILHVSILPHFTWSYFFPWQEITFNLI